MWLKWAQGNYDIGVCLFKLDDCTHFLSLLAKKILRWLYSFPSCLVFLQTLQPWPRYLFFDLFTCFLFVCCLLIFVLKISNFVCSSFGAYLLVFCSYCAHSWFWMWCSLNNNMCGGKWEMGSECIPRCQRHGQHI